MKVIVQEYGTLMISIVTGGCIIEIGQELVGVVRPIIEAFLLSML